MALDLDVRKQCQTNNTDHISLEAGAGSGKTATLISRILHWILKTGWDRQAHEENEDQRALKIMQRVVAITFTEAAAEEMVERLGKALISLCSYTQGNPVVGFFVEETGLSSADVQHRSRLLIGVIDQMRISTIHSFCRSVLKSYPLEAGIHPQFEVDPDRSKATQRAHDILVRNFYRQLRSSSRLPFRTIFEAGISLNQLRIDMLKAVHIDAFPLSNPIAEANLRPTYSKIISAIAELQELAQVLPVNKRSTHPKDLQSLQILAQILEQGLSKVDQLRGLIAHEQDIMQWQIEGAKSIDRLKKWSKPSGVSTSSKISDTLKEEMAACSAQLSLYLSNLKYYRPYLITQVISVLNDVVPELQRDLKKLGITSFSDLLHKTAVLLKNNRIIAEKIRLGIDLLLVDEFQDTSIDQCEIIEILGLQPNRLFPKLFIVGDPKQSIYGWLNADISSYFAFSQKIENFRGQHGMQGHAWKLRSNFRSLPTILKAVEKTFAGYMNNVEGLQADFSPLDCMRIEDKEERPPVELWTAWPQPVCESLRHVDQKVASKTIKNIVSEDIMMTEAEALARDLLIKNRQHGVAWKECAVLFRSTTNLDRFLHVLKNHQIPYAVTRDKNYYRRREVLELLSLFRCIVSPLDQISLISVLRSSMVGLPDAALFLLWKHGFPEFFSGLSQLNEAAYLGAEARLRSIRPQIDLLASGIDGYEDLENWMDSLCHFLRAIRRLREDVLQLPSDVFLTRVRRLIGFDISEVRAYQGNYRLANLDRFFFTIQKLLGEHKGDWGQVLNIIQQSIEENQDAEEARPADPNQDAVQIMTIHKSKGLDFRQVYVLELHRGSYAGRSEDFFSGTCGIEHTQEFSGLGLCTLGYGEEQNRRKRVEVFERLRLLYVAMTRAKDQLILSGSFPAQMNVSSQDQVTLMTEHLQQLLVHNKVQELWRFPQSQALKIRYLGTENKSTEYAISAVRAIPSVQTLKKHQELLEQSPVQHSKGSILRSTVSKHHSFEHYAHIEAAMVPLLLDPANIRKHRLFLNRKLAVIQSPLFLLRDFLANLVERIPQLQMGKTLWYNRNISIDGSRYRVHRLEDRNGELVLVEFVFLETVQYPLISACQSNWSTDEAILKVCQFLSKKFQQPIKAEIWDVCTQKRWCATQSGLQDVISPKEPEQIPLFPPHIFPLH